VRDGDLEDLIRRCDRVQREINDLQLTLGAVCPACRAWPIRDPVTPGPAWPTVCRACFVEVDQLAEEIERHGFAPAHHLVGDLLELPDLRFRRLSRAA